MEQERGERFCWYAISLYPTNASANIENNEGKLDNDALAIVRADPNVKAIHEDGIISIASFITQWARYSSTHHYLIYSIELMLLGA